MAINDADALATARRIVASLNYVKIPTPASTVETPEEPLYSSSEVSNMAVFKVLCIYGNLSD